MAVAKLVQRIVLWVTFPFNMWDLRKASRAYVPPRVDLT